MKTTFNLDKIVWYMHDNVPRSSKINRIRQIKYMDYVYPDKLPSDGDWDGKKTEFIETSYEVFIGTWTFLKESLVFASKEELIKSL